MQFVYFIQAKSRINDENEKEKQIIKIGSSFNVPQRLKQLQTSNGNKLELLNQFECKDAKLLEKKLHNYYKDFRIEGEWFEFSTNELENYYDITTKFVLDINKKLDLHTCNICDFSTYRKENFDKHNKSYSHLRKINPDAIIDTKNYECNRCHKSFKVKTDYTRHMNRKNPCNLAIPNSATSCQAVPNIPDQDITKLINILTGLKSTNELKKNQTNISDVKYKCEYCHTSFAQKSSLNRHLNGRCKIKTEKDSNGENSEDIFRSLLAEYEEKHRMELEEMKQKMEKKNDQINELVTEVKKLNKKVLVKAKASRLIRQT